MRERIGSYRIERILADEGMGLVYKGRHDTLGRDAAIKTLLPKNSGDPDLRRRLLHEARAQARLNHPNIVTVYDFFEDDGELFIAMEYIDGETLERLLSQAPHRRLPLDEALTLFDQVLAALDWVHGEKIIHRDVKPSNVMVCDGKVKLTDFGIALLSETSRVTASHHIVGTLPWMSPEQLDGIDVDHRTDIYSAALVLYRMLAGRPAFIGNDYVTQRQERIAGPPGLRTFVPALAAPVCDAIGIALRRDREQRFDSVAEFRKALHEGNAGFFVASSQTTEALPDAVSEIGINEPPEIAREPESRRAASIVALVIATAFIAVISVLRTQSKRQSFPSTAPPQKAAVVTTITPPVVLEPAGSTTRAPEPQPPPPAPIKTSPFPIAPVEDNSAKLLREIELLRDEIRRGFAQAEQALAAERFSEAIDTLDRVAELAQRHPADFSQERTEIAQLRTRVNDARVTADTRKAEDALWAAQLSGIEKDLGEAHWIEAERMAARIANDAHAPEPVITQARALLQQAKDGRRNALLGTVIGTTTNTIRKPSSPPRKDH